ncbi:hypothetical protein SAMD00019534_090850 [Acytostelium subglobosum LB1]|uniref:hypothetical protein n=1 Tax=Acytostelium subglobosum LB1 TaxID=1410327 RepID=UPI0006451508|nr:hypothetical protein SAMD00019534_090850 [Acytostelium subglobosum LB1]GAM25910.1 hypothetical protein SAMD00019534_090850 [Acytostelium subglobosum LB1]|eukprot:XP_012750953.1 hypothetical protein SAMD00019534_090850 [Acytostelium subglobosum LB1]
MWSHCTLRRLYSLLSAKMLVWKPADKDEIEDMVKAFESVGNYALAHNKLEEDTAFPFIAEQDPKFKEAIKAIEADHKKFTQDWNAIQPQVQAIAKLTPGTGQDQIAALAAKVKEITEFVFKLFAEEEKICLPFMVNIPKDKQQKLGKTIEELSRKDENSKFFFCAMMDASKHDKEMAETFKKETPWFARTMFSAIFLKKEYGWFQKVVEI